MKYGILHYVLIIFCILSISSCTQQNNEIGEKVIETTQEVDQHMGGGNIGDMNDTDYIAGSLVLYNFGSMQKISSPYILIGQAPRSWFFEGSFPVILSTLDDEIIVQTYATGDWLAPVGDRSDLNGQDMIDFSSNLIFNLPEQTIGDAKIQFIREDMSGEGLRETTEVLVRLSK